MKFLNGVSSYEVPYLNQLLVELFFLQSLLCIIRFSFQYLAMVIIWIAFSNPAEMWSPGTYDVLLTLPSRLLLVQSQHWKYQYYVWNLFKVNNRNLNLFFYCELWTDISHCSVLPLLTLDVTNCKCWQGLICCFWYFLQELQRL